MTTNIPKMMTVREIAATGVLTETAIRRLLREGKLPAIYCVLLSLKDMDRMYRKEKYGEMTSTENLVLVLKKLNKQFNDDSKVRDTDRSLFFSGLMIALTNNNFRSTYKGIQAPSEEEVAGKKVKILECEAIVFAFGAGGSLGRTHYVNGKFIASNLCFILTPKKDSGYDIDMQFYNSYFAAIRKQLVSDLADGTSKLTIGDTDLKEYYIDYIPYDKQQAFVRDSLAEVNTLRKQLAEAEGNLQNHILSLV